MKLRKKIRIIAATIGGVTLLLLLVLIAHIALAKPVAYDNATIQVSRIDFKEPITPDQATEITKNLKSIPGVTSDNLIIKNNVVVYFHDNRVTDSKKVFAALMAKGKYDAKPFTIPEGIASQSVCPVMNTNSFSYKFSKGIQRIFN